MGADLPVRPQAELHHELLQPDLHAKVRPSAIGSNEYLKFEEVIRDESAIQTDERLEKAVYRASEVRQLSLFDAT